MGPAFVLPPPVSVNLGLSYSVSVSTSFSDSFSVCVSLCPHLDFLFPSPALPGCLYLPTSVSVHLPLYLGPPRKVGWDTAPMERFLTPMSSALGDSLHPQRPVHARLAHLPSAHRPQQPLISPGSPRAPAPAGSVPCLLLAWPSQSQGGGVWWGRISTR